MIKAVFFDLYQTLVRYQPSQAELEAKALVGLGFKTDEAAMELPILAANEFMYKEIAVRPLSKRTREEVVALYTEYQRVVLKEAGIKGDEKVVLKLLGVMQQARMDLVLYDDGLPVLTDLKQRGLVTGLISNIEKNMDDTIKQLGIASHLDVIVTSLDAGAAKPQPEIFQFAMKKADVTPSVSLYIGDQYSVDIAGAKAAGMKGILLDRTDYYKEKLDCPKIKSLKQIIDFIV
jgi:putative hydrolase of the HAD superfamily